MQGFAKKFYRENETAGLVTLTEEHVDVGSRHVEFEFTGKSQKDRELRADDRRLAGQLEDLEEHDGEMQFTYENGLGVVEAKA